MFLFYVSFKIGLQFFFKNEDLKKKISANKVKNCWLLYS